MDVYIVAGYWTKSLSRGYGAVDFSVEVWEGEEALFVGETEVAFVSRGIERPLLNWLCGGRLCSSRFPWTPEGLSFANGFLGGFIAAG